MFTFVFMNMELTDKQKKGFYYLEKAIKRVFPFIRSLDFSTFNPEEYNIYVNVEVDFIKFLKFENVPMKQHHANYGLKNAVDYFDNYTITYLFALVSDELTDQYANEYNKKISNALTNIYKSLPSEFTLKNEYESYEGIKYDTKIVVVYEYTVYIDPKDVEEDEIKRGNI